jgi:hypothetical protein
VGRAKVVAPPPEDYVPEPLVSQPKEDTEQWVESNYEETVEEITEPSAEELEKDRIAQEKYEELQKQKAQVLAEVDVLRKANEELLRLKEASDRAKEEQILRSRERATEQKASQLNLIQARKPSLISRLKDYFRKKRIKVATIPRANYEQAIINQASVAVPKMLDDIEKMHEHLTILEELLIKHKERQKTKD